MPPPGPEQQNNVDTRPNGHRQGHIPWSRLKESMSRRHTFCGPHKPGVPPKDRCVSSIVRLFDCLPDGRTHRYCIRSISRSQCDADQPSKRRPPGQVPSGSNTPPFAQCARPPSIMGMHFFNGESSESDCTCSSLRLIQLIWSGRGNVQR
jgi:hypothetical protein